MQYVKCTLHNAELKSLLRKSGDITIIFMNRPASLERHAESAASKPQDYNSSSVSTFSLCNVHFAFRAGGTSLIELAIALVVAAVVVSMVFSGYTHLTRMFYIKQRKARQVHRMVRLRRNIDRALGRADAVVRTGFGSVTLRDRRDSREFRIYFSGRSLRLDGRMMADSIVSCSFSLRRGNDPPYESALMWEVIAQNGGWIGGSRIVPLRESQK